MRVTQPSAVHDLASQLRRRNLRAATALFAGVFGVGAALGIRPLLDGSDPGAFFVPAAVCIVSIFAFWDAGRGREQRARTVFVVLAFTYLLVLVTIAPATLRLTLGFPLTVLATVLFHLLHAPAVATRLGVALLAVLGVGYVAHAIEVPESFDWTLLTVAATQVMVLAVGSTVLGWLGRVWGEALQAADQARAQLEEAHQIALQANRAKSTFLATMSHELRTPLNAVIGYAELATDDLEAEGTVDVGDLDRIRKAGTHLLGLVDQVLDLSRIDAGKLDLQSDAVSLATIAEEVGDTLRPQLQAKGNQLVLSLADVDAVSLDPLRTRQIVTNLLGNATKFTERGRICIEVAQDASSVWLQVIDDGPGIPANRLDAIFVPFEQASDRVQHTHGGTGLGLAISRRLAREMGGDLTACSVLGEGATFTLAFPRRSPR